MILSDIFQYMMQGIAISALIWFLVAVKNYDFVDVPRKLGQQPALPAFVFLVTLSGLFILTQLVQVN